MMKPADFFDQQKHSAIKQLLLKLGFHLSHWIIIEQHLLEQQNMKDPPPRKFLSEEEKFVEGRIIESQSIAKTGNNKLAIAKLLEALQFIEKSDDAKISIDLKGIVIANLGVFHQSIGSFAAAKQYHLQHLEMFPEAKDAASHGRASANLGIVFQSLGEPLKALEYHETHLRISRDVMKDLAAEGRAYCNLGITYQSLGLQSKAIECHQRHLDICKAVNDKAGESRAYANIGILMQSTWRFEEALRLHLSHLRICFEETRDKRGEGSSYGNIGNTFKGLGSFELSEYFHEKHLAITKAELTFDAAASAKALGNLGLALFNQSKFDSALEVYEKLRQFWEAKSDRSGICTVNSNMSDVQFHNADFDASLETGKKALATYETIRSTRLDQAIDQRWHLFWAQIALMVNRNMTDEALLLLENFRAHALAASQLRGFTVFTKVKSVGELMDISRDAGAVIVVMLPMPERGAVYTWILQPHSPRPIFEKLLCDHLDRLDEMIQAGVSGSCMQTSCIASTDPAELTAFLAEIGASKFQEFFQDICGWNTPHQVQSGLESLRENLPLFSELVEEANARLKSISPAEIMQLLDDNLAKLYKTLIAPIAQYLPADPGSPVVFVPCGFLQNVPFAALREPGRPHAYLINSHTLATAFSITQMKGLDRQRRMRDVASQDKPNKALILADAHNVLEFQGHSVPQSTEGPREIEFLSRQMIEVGRCDVQTLKGSNATFAALTEAMQKSRVVHIAAQGCLNEHENRAPHLAFAPSPVADVVTDSNGELSPREPNTLAEKSCAFVAPVDLLEISSDQTELLTLSGICNSGWGATLAKDIARPIGFTALVQMFLSKSSSLVYPLWRVSEAASIAFFERFYHAYLSAERPSTTQALRAAMLECICSGSDLAHPRVWAAFAATEVGSLSHQEQMSTGASTAGPQMTLGDVCLDPQRKEPAGNGSKGKDDETTKQETEAALTLTALAAAARGTRPVAVAAKRSAKMAPPK